MICVWSNDDALKVHSLILIRRKDFTRVNFSLVSTTRSCHGNPKSNMS